MIYQWHQEFPPESVIKKPNQIASCDWWTSLKDSITYQLYRTYIKKKDSAPVSACQWTKKNLDELRQKDRKTKRQKDRKTDWLTNWPPDHHLTIWPSEHLTTWLNELNRPQIDPCQYPMNGGKLFVLLQIQCLYYCKFSFCNIESSVLLLLQILYLYYCKFAICTIESSVFVLLRVLYLYYCKYKFAGFESLKKSFSFTTYSIIHQISGNARTLFNCHVSMYVL